MVLPRLQATVLSLSVLVGRMTALETTANLTLYVSADTLADDTVIAHDALGAATVIYGTGESDQPAHRGAVIQQVSTQAIRRCL